MKITWFGGSTFRLYVGGKIFVTDADKAPDGINAHEVAAAADHRIDLSDGIADFPYLDAENWTPRRPRRALDMPDEQLYELYTISGEALFIDEPEEGPVIVAPAGQTAWGRFADNGVIVLYGAAHQLAGDISNLILAARPKLLMVAVDGLTDALIGEISPVANGCAVQIMEPGLSLEV